MTQQTTQTTHTTHPSAIVHPKRRDIFFHFIKTGRLIGALSSDRRISIVRKVLFFAIILALLAVLLFPDVLDEIGLSLALPVVGTVLGVPVDAGFDWIAFALASVSLLRIFPAEIVSEHYQHLFVKDTSRHKK
ncbi:MAG TPA: hypothetical protein VF458_00130 [Ktedonobacteraceae bacterium]